MNLHIVKVKCPILTTKSNGEELVKTISTAIGIYNAGTFGNAETETAKYFEKKASPENSHSVVGISKMNIHSVMYQVTPEQAEDLENEPLWFKIKVELKGDGERPFTNVYLVMGETMEKAQEHVKRSWDKTTFEVSIKTSAEIKLMEYIELEGPADSENSENVKQDFTEEFEDFGNEPVDPEPTTEDLSGEDDF